MFKVLLTDEIRDVGIKKFEEEGIEVILAENPKPETIEAIVQDFDAMISRNTFIDEKIMAKAKKLKVIASHGTGTDHIDVKEATKRNIYVVNTPGANAQGVAELSIGLMINLSHRIIEGDSALKIYHDYYLRHKLVGHDLNKRTVGILGLGNVGIRLAKICKYGFDMTVLGYDPYVSANQMDAIGIIKKDNLEELLKESDFVSINCPACSENFHLIDINLLKLMKPTAYIINCARGQLVDEEALYQALKENIIAGAAVDVYEHEPPCTDNPIFKLPNFISTPHIATNTEESIDKMSLMSAVDIIHVLKNEPQLANVVNKDLNPNKECSTKKQI